MRKAFYYDNVIPPKNWLILTSLLWDKIYISPLLHGLLKIGYHFKEVRDEFLTKLYYSDNDLFDTFSPQANWEKAQHTLNEAYFDIYRNLTREFIVEMQNNLSATNQIVQLAEEMHHCKSKKDFTAASNVGYRLIDTFNAYKTKTIEKANYFNSGFYNHRFKELFPEFVYFFDKEQSFKNYCSSNKEALLCTIESFIPINLNLISIKQIKDFRENTISKRIKFRKASEEILKEIMHSSTESEFDNSLKIFKDFLYEELNILKKDYRDCKINASIKSIKVLTLGINLPSILAAISIPIFEPASIVASLSLASASFLSNIEKGKSEIHKSPWGYLMSLKDLK